MRTTLNIDDDLLRAAKELARLRGSTAGAVLSDLARAGLEQERPSPKAPVRNGVPLLPHTRASGLVVPGPLGDPRG